MFMNIHQRPSLGELHLTGALLSIRMKQRKYKQRKYETTNVRKNEIQSTKQLKYETTKGRCETTKLRNNESAKGPDGPIRTP